MIRTLPRQMAELFILFRGELIDCAQLCNGKRPVSIAVLRKCMMELVLSFRGLEDGVLQALENDPDYHPDPWDLDDIITLTERRLP